MAPIVHGLEARYYGKISFYYLDADDPATTEFQRQFGFRVQPEFYLLDGQGIGILAMAPWSVPP